MADTNNRFHDTYHCGGGGNCVFFSTAKQLNPSIRLSIKNQLADMYDKGEPETQKLIQDAAKTMIANQFKAGFANTTLNSDLHDYNYTGQNSADKIVRKLLGANTDLADALALRLMTQLKCSTPEDFTRYLGNDSGNGMDIYTGILGEYPKDILNVISAAAPPSATLPAIVTVAPVPGTDLFMTKLYQMDKKTGEVKTAEETTFGRGPDRDLVNGLLFLNGANESNVIGLMGQGNHCKAMGIVGPREALPDGSLIQPVTADSRTNASQGIKGFLANIIKTFTAVITGKYIGFEKSPAVAKPDAGPVEKDSGGHTDVDGFDMVDEFSNDMVQEKAPVQVQAQAPVHGQVNEQDVQIHEQVNDSESMDMDDEEHYNPFSDGPMSLDMMEDEIEALYPMPPKSMSADELINESLRKEGKVSPEEMKEQTDEWNKNNRPQTIEKESDMTLG